MVLEKKLNYGFLGYQAPPVPRAARSARRRAHLRKSAEENQTCAFDLLASVAGKILLEGQNSSTSLSNGKCQEENDQYQLKEEQHDAIRPLNLDSGDREISEVCLRVHDVTSKAHDHSCKDNLIGTCPGGPISEATSSGFSDKIISDGKRVMSSNQNRIVSQSRKLERFSSGLYDSCVPIEDHGQEQIHSLTVGETLVGIGSNGHNSQDLRFHSRKSLPTLVSSDGCCKPNLIKKDYACHSVFPSRYKYVKVVSKDNDEKYSLCTQRNAYRKTSRFPARHGDWRMRKLLASRYCRMHPSANIGDLSDCGKQFPMTHQNLKHGYKRQRSHRVYALKKRKLFHYSSSSGGTTGCDGIYDSREEATTDMSASHFANDILTSANDSLVKLKIRSFRVPELYIDIPKTATVGSLKKTVMEAISSLLGDGLRVGVLVKGRKIRDDSETLFQTGISHGSHLDSLGFTIEPNPSQASSAMYAVDLSSRDITQPVLSERNQSAEAPSTAHQYNLHPSPDFLPKSVGHCTESDHDSAPSPAEVSKERSMFESSSRALVNVPELDADAHAVVLSQQKSKGSEMAQRRIRRPFSVSEVEALVQAVEKLGTGRWRDVKLHAFDNAKHRTYVDLKDKWKTLVHTARISPQQRRGEPVPQELLDKVISAHAYWSQQQAKQRHLKTPHLR